MNARETLDRRVRDLDWKVAQLTMRMDDLEGIIRARLREEADAARR